MTKKPLFITTKRLQRASNEEVRQLFQTIFKVTYPEHTQIRNNILTALFYCSYLTAADLSYYLGMPEKSFKSLHKQLNDMEQAGLIKKAPLKTKDAFSRVLYYPTESGFSMAAAYIGVPYLFSYKRRGKQITTMHDYSIGLNALQLMLYGNSFIWNKEVSYSEIYGGVKKNGSICIDAVCDFVDTPYRMYIEEDLGNESNGILLGKLEKYYQYDLLRNGTTEAVVYSFRQPYLTCDAPQIMAYSAKMVDKVMKWLMKENKGLNEALASLQWQKNDLENLALYETIESLCGVLELEEGKKDITADFLALYIKDLEELKLDFRVRDHNILQETFTRKKFQSLAGILARNYRMDSSSMSSYLSDLMKGFPVYCTSTTLLSNEIPFYFYKQASMQYAMSFCLKKVFPDIQVESYEEVLSPPLSHMTGHMRLLGLRNAFTFRHGKVCVEYLGRDLGAVLRTLRYIDEYMSKETKTFLVCIIEQFSDFYFFYKNIFPKNIQIPRSKEGIPYLMFLDKTLITDDPVLFSLKDNGQIQFFRKEST